MRALLLDGLARRRLGRLGPFGRLALLGLLRVLSALLAKVVNSMNRVQQQLLIMAACEGAYWMVQDVIKETTAARENPGGGRMPIVSAR